MGSVNSRCGDGPVPYTDRSSDATDNTAYNRTAECARGLTLVGHDHGLRPCQGPAPVFLRMNGFTRPKH
eukprot:1718200-Prymnesium_polylepis.1